MSGTVPGGAPDARADPPPLTVEARPGRVHAVRFTAMGTPCEVLLETADPALALELARPAAIEALRIEHKFSRYRADSAVAAINRSNGHAVAIDTETARLLDFADACHRLSEGLFDITSGVLRECWTFDGSDRLPAPAAVERLLARIGFPRLQRGEGTVVLPAGMEIDLGGIAKEYAVDRAHEIVDRRDSPPALVNFGGDLRASRPLAAGPWQVGIERDRDDAGPAAILELTRGALATSGDTHRFLQRDGVRYGHILDPRTGWPVPGAPRSVTIAAATCVEAGTLSTIAMLKGAGAEAFLEEFGVRYWCQR
jgi:thiamine biosynthesis lipoprotein